MENDNSLDAVAAGSGLNELCRTFNFRQLVRYKRILLSKISQSIFTGEYLFQIDSDGNEADEQQQSVAAD